MSGGAEANFDLGYAVNVDSNLHLLKAAYAHAKATGQAGPESQKKLSYVFVSSLAVYGGPKCQPTDRVVPDETAVVPGTSYGVEKSIVELYVYDYGRRGWLDAKSVRLPTVCIRSGAVSWRRTRLTIQTRIADLIAIHRRLVLHLWPHPRTPPGPALSRAHRLRPRGPHARQHASLPRQDYHRHP